MTTTVDVKSFVDELVAEVVEPAADALMETRYFRDLRAGTLTIRRLQGYALHTHGSTVRCSRAGPYA